MFAFAGGGGYKTLILYKFLNSDKAPFSSASAYEDFVPLPIWILLGPLLIVANEL